MEVVLKDLVLSNIENYKAALSIAEIVKDARQQILDNFISGFKDGLNDCQLFKKLVEENYNIISTIVYPQIIDMLSLHIYLKKLALKI